MIFALLSLVPCVFSKRHFIQYNVAALLLQPTRFAVPLDFLTSEESLRYPNPMTAQPDVYAGSVRVVPAHVVGLRSKARSEQAKVQATLTPLFTNMADHTPTKLWLRKPEHAPSYRAAKKDPSRESVIRHQ